MIHGIAYILPYILRLPIVSYEKPGVDAQQHAGDSSYNSISGSSFYESFAVCWAELLVATPYWVLPIPSLP
jgi:hypothetical protein